jgi:large subunit ribosomal protein L21
MFAVISLGSTQYKIAEGDIINAEYIPSAVVGTRLVCERVLAAGGEERTGLGTPLLPHASVHLQVEEHTADAKIVVFKKRRRKRYQVTQGHRRQVTRLRVEKINVDWDALTAKVARPSAA